MILFLPWNERKSKNERIKEWKRIRKRKGYVNLVHLPKKRKTHWNVYKRYENGSRLVFISKLYRSLPVLRKWFDWCCRVAMGQTAQWEGWVSKRLTSALWLEDFYFDLPTMDQILFPRCWTYFLPLWNWQIILW